MSATTNDEKKSNQENDDKEEKNKTSMDSTVIAAHKQAEKDIKKDADLSIHSPNDDLDEGETARLGDGKNELI